MCAHVKQFCHFNVKLIKSILQMLLFSLFKVFVNQLFGTFFSFLFFFWLVAPIASFKAVFHYLSFQEFIIDMFHYKLDL